MAWTAPRSWSACEVVTAAIMNTHVRDNLNQTFPAIVTTQGDSVWATGPNAGTRLPVGTDGDLITASSGCNAGVRWSNGQVSVSYSASLLDANHRFRVIQNASSNGEITMSGYNNTTSWRLLWDDNLGTGISTACALQLWNGASRLMTFFGGPVAGQVQIGSGAACNTSMNANGLTINQGTSGSNQELLAFQSGVKHGIVGYADTNTFADFREVNAEFGGLLVTGMSASENGVQNCIYVRAIAGAALNTSKSNAAAAGINLETSVKSGPNNTNAASTGNLLVIANAASARFIFQGGGDLYADSGLSASAFDAHDDVQMVRALEVERNPGTVIRDQFDSWLKYNRKDLEAANLATFNDPAEGGDGSVFVNVMGLQRLHSGAIWQTHKYVRQLEERIGQLEQLLIGPPKAAA